MKSQWDIEVYNRYGQLVLGAEVKNKPNVSPEWASQLRQNILAHGVYPDPPYLLMAFPDQFFLWVKGSGKRENEEPDFVVDARPILLPYLRQVRTDVDRLSEQSLELIVSSWLSQLVHRDMSADQLIETDRWLVTSRLLDTIADGKVALAHEALLA